MSCRNDDKDIRDTKDLKDTRVIVPLVLGVLVESLVSLLPERQSHFGLTTNFIVIPLASWLPMGQYTLYSPGWSVT